MRNPKKKVCDLTVVATVVVGIIFCSLLPARTQNSALQEKLADIKQSSAANKQALARYTWLEQQTISLKGEMKKTQQFQVQIGLRRSTAKDRTEPTPTPQPSGAANRVPATSTISAIFE